MGAIPSIANARWSAARVASARFAGSAPATGITILPLEQQASDAIVEAVNRTFGLFKQVRTSETAVPEAMVEAFVDAIHLCQSNLGSLRFWHQMNTEARARYPVNGRPLMTPPEKLAELEDWGRTFRRHIQRQSDPTARQVLTLLSDAWDAIVALTRQYPDQHVYDDFQRGMQQVADILSRLPKNGTISHTEPI